MRGRALRKGCGDIVPGEAGEDGQGGGWERGQAEGVAESGSATPLAPEEGHEPTEGADWSDARDGGPRWATASSGRSWPGEAGKDGKGVRGAGAAEGRDGNALVPGEGHEPAEGGYDGGLRSATAAAGDGVLREIVLFFCQPSEQQRVFANILLLFTLPPLRLVDLLPSQPPPA